MIQYQQLLQHILDNGVHKADRTGTGTLSVFGYQMRFNLNEGFPLVTTKKMFSKGMIHELLWFISGRTDVKYLQENGVNFWDSWVGDDGTIGFGYGKQLRDIDYITQVPIKKYTALELKLIKSTNPISQIDRMSNTNKTKFSVGQIIETDYNGSLIIIKELPANDKINRIHWLIRFTETNYETIAIYSDLLHKKIKDPFHRSVFNVGYYGIFDETDKNLEMLLDTWREMFRRCYNQKAEGYKSYGAKGVHVEESWHCFANFQKDFKKIPGWELKLEYPEQYSLDKDILWASNRYGLNTCVWASKKEQSGNTSTNCYFQAKSPEGKIHTFSSIREAYSLFKLNLSAVHRCIHGKLKTHKNWSEFTKLLPKENHAMRYRHIDQLKTLIAGIKHNPESRRHVISLWNSHDIDRMNLPVCHGNIIQFNVVNGKLSCLMYQRSGDTFLGVPVNIASYALLTHMIAQVCGLGVGDFVHIIGDAHLYMDHIDQTELQLTREPKVLPLLKLNPSIKDIDDFKYEDITIEGYDPHPAIKGNVSV
jgi:thymidylate synthase